MKKKTLIVLVVLLLCVSLVGLTACNFSDLFKNNNSTNQNENTNIEQNNNQNVNTPNEDNSGSNGSDDEKLLLLTKEVVGKTFVFSDVNLYFEKVWYPTDGTVADSDASYMPTEEEMQEYVNILAMQYSGVKMVFEKNNILKMVFPNDPEGSMTQEYGYLQEGNIVYIGEIVEKTQNGETSQVLEWTQKAEVLSTRLINLQFVLFEDNEVPIYIEANLQFSM